MNNSAFWGSAPTKSNIPSGNKNKKKKSNGKVAKSLGITGIALLVIVGILGGLGYFFIARPAIALSSSAKILKADMNSLGAALQARDLVEMNSVLDKIEDDLTDLRQEREDSFGWAKDVSMFRLSEFYSDSDRFINAGFYGISAIRETTEIVTPFADAAGLKVSEDQEAPAEEGLMEAVQSWITLMPEVADQMDGVIEKMSKVGEELKPIDVSKYPEKIRGVEVRSNIEFAKNTLSNADEYAPDIKEALTIFPSVLGVGTPVKRYMIIMQNDKEIRPTGGFMTNYATFKIQDALLQSDFTSKDMYSIDLTLDIIDATYDFPDAPDAYTKYLLVERWYSRDMNYSPDFPTSMDQLMVFYNMASRIDPYEIKPVNGIFAIDTHVIAELLEVTGPVTVNGITYTKDNVVLELEKIASLELREQANRKKVLGDLMEAMLVNVFEADKNLWPKLIEKGVDLAVRKHVQIYVMDNPEAQALIEKYGLGGTITENVEGDYSMVVSTNLGGDKTNWFVNKEVNHKLEKDGEKWLRTVEITYTYNEPSSEYGPFIKRFRDWVRVYAPEGSEFISFEGTEDGTMTGNELGKDWWSAFLEMGPGESKTVTAKYYLPEGVVDGNTYNLLIQKQGGTEGETHTVTTSTKTETVELKKDTKVSISL